MLHTKRIGRIALALSIAIFSGVSLAAGASQIANLPLINYSDARSSGSAIPGHAADYVHILYPKARQVLTLGFKQNYKPNPTSSGALPA